MPWSTSRLSNGPNASRANRTHLGPDLYLLRGKDSRPGDREEKARHPGSRTVAQRKGRGRGRDRSDLLPVSTCRSEACAEDGEGIQMSVTKTPPRMLVALDECTVCRLIALRSTPSEPLADIVDRLADEAARLTCAPKFSPPRTRTETGVRKGGLLEPKKT